MQFVQGKTWVIVSLAVAILSATAFFPTSFADDIVKRKPLPKFIRNAVIADRYLGTRDVDELLQFERAEPVCIQFLKRPGVPEFARMEAIEKLAELRKTDPVAELLPWIAEFDADDTDEGAKVLSDLSLLLPQQSAVHLKAHRSSLEELIKSGQNAPTRQAALAGIMLADGGSEAAWTLVGTSSDLLFDLLKSVPLLAADVPREALFANVKPLMQNAPNRKVGAAAIEAAALLDPRGRETFDILSEFILEGKQSDACVRAICNIPSDQWTDDRRRPLADGLLKHLQKMPLESRTSRDAKNTTKLITSLAGLLPSQDEASIREALDRLSVKVIRIKAVEEQMRYDETVLILRAGQGVELVFENHDIMPHNLVIVDSPEAREEIGIAADRMQNDADAIKKGYLPDSEKILHASKMIQPGETDSLFFTAPENAGTYAFVCTFPGHWSKMYGAIAVVEDVEDFLATNQPLPTADDLLGIRTVEWTYDALAQNLASLDQGRSFENGQRMFLKASCFSCHKVGDEGGRIGPELTKISEQYKTSEEILKHIMLPSEKVEEKYATVIIETGDGELLKGVVVDDNEEALMIKQDPLSTCDPTVVEKDNIEDVTRSKLSPMPEQLLNTIVEQADVYDLLAYLIAGGNPEHPLFESSR